MDAADFLMRRKQHFAEEEWTDPRPAEVRAEDRHLRAAEPRVARIVKVMHEVGAERRPAGKPAGQGGRPVQGQRPAGQQARPATQGARPAAPQTGRPAPPEPEPAAPQTGRPAPQGTRPAAPQTGRPAPQGTRPAAPQTGRPAPQVDRPVKPAQNNGNPQDPGWKSKNFMSDDDEFEFEFLNWDGDEEQ